MNDRSRTTTLAAYKRAERERVEAMLAAQEEEAERGKLWLMQEYARKERSAWEAEWAQRETQLRAEAETALKLETARLDRERAERRRLEAVIASLSGKTTLNPSAPSVPVEANDYLQQLAHLTKTEAVLKEGIDYLRGEIAERDRQLEMVSRSRAVRVLQVYWRTRDSARSTLKRTAATPYRAARSLYHRALPLERRLAFRRWRERAGLQRSSVLSPPADPPRVYQAAPAPTPTLPAEKPAVVVVPRNTGKPDILIFSIIEFEARYQRPQQLAVHFAREGHRVFYVSSAKFLGMFDPPYQCRVVTDGVFEVLLNSRGVQPHIYETLIEPAMQQQFITCLELFRQQEGVTSAVSLVHLPFWAPLAIDTQTRWSWLLLYDCMDEWEDFPLITPEILAGERQLLERADLVSVTGKILYDKWSTQTRRCALVRNGVDFEFFATNTRPNTLLAHLQHPIIGYYGAIAEWIDLELIRFLALECPDYQFVYIGDVFIDVSSLKSLPNVHLLGRRPYPEMPLYLHNFDVCMIPFRLYKVTHAVDPVKFYEYISAGKPVVASRLHELESFGDYLYLADTHEEFLEQIRRALNESDAEIVQRRIQLARESTWAARVSLLQAEIQSCYPKVSIIIVTYQNVALTRACIESILRCTAYPHYEIIIIDNASSDETPAYLRTLAETEPTVKIILNDENRGFAAANNQGITIARGEFVILLNNDTVVTPGWIEGLIAHLKDPRIGMVGPVTNFVGNEAKIEVNYRDLDAMQTFAADYTRRHAGQVFEISMLAMFCVALRRDTIDQIGLLDESFGIGMFEDDDYSERIKQHGLRVICTRDVFVHHHGQAAFKKLLADNSYQALWAKNQAYYEQKWQKQWKPHQHQS